MHEKHDVVVNGRVYTVEQGAVPAPQPRQVRIACRENGLTCDLPAERDGDTVRFPASALPYFPHFASGLTVDGRPVSAVELTRGYSPPSPAMVTLTLQATN